MLQQSQSSSHDPWSLRDLDNDDFQQAYFLVQNSSEPFLHRWSSIHYSSIFKGVNQTTQTPPLVCLFLLTAGPCPASQHGASHRDAQGCCTAPACRGSSPRPLMTQRRTDLAVFWLKEVRRSQDHEVPGRTSEVWWEDCVQKA